MVPGSARIALAAAALTLLFAAAALAQTQVPAESEAVSVSGVVVVDDDGLVLIQDDSGVDYLVLSPDLSSYSGEGIIGEGVTWVDENGDQILSLSGFEIIDIVITPQEEPSSREEKAQQPRCPTSQRADLRA